MLNNSIENLIQELAEKQFCVANNVLSPEACDNLSMDLEEHYRDGVFKQASIGRGAGLQVQSRIRGDSTYWLDEKAPTSKQEAFFAFMQQLQKSLNENFYIGVKELEAHYALYPPGTGYEKHIDQHAGTSHRKITFILYLNKDWRSEYGGELLVFDPKNPEILLHKIEPTWGRLVLFRSEIFPHQVASCTQDRKSLTGWFRS